MEEALKSILVTTMGEYLGTSVHSFVWNKYYLAYTVLAVAYVEFCLQKQLKMKPKNQEEVDRDRKYAAFCKADAFHAESIVYRLILYAMTPIIPFRFVFGWSIAVVGCVTT